MGQDTTKSEKSPKSSDLPSVTAEIDETAAPARLTEEPSGLFLNLAKTKDFSPVSPRTATNLRRMGATVCGMKCAQPGEEARVRKVSWAANGPKSYFIFSFTFELRRFLNLCK